jgi:hypothetical protein
MDKEVTEPINPRNHLFALYCDAQGFRACVRWHGKTDSFDISSETGRAICIAMIADNATESSEGYDDDPEATIAWLHPNQYVNLMTPAEIEQVRTIQWNADPRPEPRRRNPLTGHYLNGGRGQ